MAASDNDLLFVLVLGSIFAALVMLARRHRGLVIFFWALFVLAAATTVAWGFANMQMTRLLGEPFTYQWLLYADFLQNAEATSAMNDAVNARDVSLLSGSVLTVLAVGHLAGWLAYRLSSGARMAVLAPLVLVAAAFLLVARDDAKATQLPATKTDNAIVYFLSSLLIDTRPVLFTMDTKTGNADFATAADRPAAKSSFVRMPEQPIENVVIVVLESTPWEYAEPFGGKYPVTPNLQRYAGSAQLFTNIYAHAPATNYSLFSLFTALYPDISYNSMSTAHPDVPFKTIAGVLSERGFRTSFFWSADLRFQTFDRFIKNKGFQVTKDYRDIPCDRPAFKLSTEKWQFMDHAHDICTARAFNDWIAESPDKPFFGVMMTGMTHYPYPANSERVRFAEDEKLNNYLNALKVGDEAFGMVMDKLAALGKLESTLVVVLGDHGEAFGQHDNYVHASALYEENVHVPLMLINGKLFNGKKTSTVGGVIDVAPTVLDILGLPEPREWQGRSLFSTGKPRRTFFFSPWNGYQFGYREGDLKVIYNASSDKTEVYDLASDPRERDDKIAAGEPVGNRIDPIASWVQFQRKLIASAVGAVPSTRTACVLQSISFDAASTSFRGAPRLEILVDDTPVDMVEVAGLESKASTTDAIIAELNAAAKNTRSFSIKVDDIANAGRLELRFGNDLWSGDPGGGDRNLFVTNIAANGSHVPMERYKVVEESAGIVAQGGAALYQNGSIVIEGPFVEGCR